jgi:dipeptidyl-peptidase-4
MKRLLLVCILLTLAAWTIYCQNSLLTVAEKSDFKSTSTYNDVVSFIEHLKKLSPYIRVESIAKSVEGRDIPLLIIGKPLPESPGELINDKRIVVYVQANIHAGEVEGKEAALMYARDILRLGDQEILKNIVLLVCPIFNPDGNEKISPANRSYQNGPVNGVGVRYNGQFLDLNRDAMKAESPEVKGVLTKVFNRWDPSVFMDCHTTNGSYHVEPVTFTWMVNPNGDRSLINYMRDKMIPELSQTLFNRYGVENCYYGEFADMTDPEKGWYFDAADTRYMSNYVGIRNRLGILNENYVYADFKSRVIGCYYLIQSLVGYASKYGSEIKDLLVEADNRTVERGLNPSLADSFAIEYLAKPAPYKVTVKTYEVEIIVDAEGRRRYRPSDREKTVSIPYYIDYYPVESVKFPFAYLITVPDPAVKDLLTAHGIKVESLTEAANIEVERFEILELKGSSRLNQGHYTNTVKGRFLRDIIDFPAGTLVVRTAQPLANVAACLLEPQSNDGLVTWNFLDRYLVPQWGTGYNPYPVYKVMDAVLLNTIIVKHN